MRIKILSVDEIKNNTSNNFDSYYVNETKINIELISYMQYAPTCSPRAQIFITPNGDRSTHNIPSPESVISDHLHITITLQSLKQDYSDLYTQSVSVKNS